jgi:hypothetical protein
LRLGRAEATDASESTSSAADMARAPRLYRTGRVNGMSSLPHLALLDREASRAAIRASIDNSTAMLTEIVNYGSQLFARANASANDAYMRLGDRDAHLPKEAIGDFHLPIMLLFLHAIEVTDAIEVLLAQSVVTPAELPLRALFESVIQLEWLLQGDTARKSFAYQLFDVNNRLRFYRSLIPSTKEGQELTAARLADHWVRDTSTATLGDPALAIKELVPLLDKPGYRQAAAEYARARGTRRVQNWFSLYDGPRTIKELATRVGRPMQYEIVYRQWSGSVHGAHLGQRVTKAGGIRAMRQASAFPTILMHTAVLSLTALDLLGNFYRPDEEAARAKWYTENISSRIPTE